MVLLGSHVPVGGGLHTAFARAERVGCTTMQIFVKNANQWSGKAQAPKDVEQFRQTAGASRIAPVVAHAAYLINLCSTNPDVLAKSRTALADELRRCEALGIAALVFHPGAHLGAGVEAGLRLIAESINLVHEATPGLHVLTTIENTAGQGTTLGSTFEQLRDIVEQVHDRNRVAICLDTCHLFTSGYPIHTADGWKDTLDKYRTTLGSCRLAVVHVNDSKKPFGSHLDRHEHIGKGAIGLEGFRPVMNDPFLAEVPKILETEKSEDMHEDVENMKALRSLIQP